MVSPSIARSIRRSAGAFGYLLRSFIVLYLQRNPRCATNLKGKHGIIIAVQPTVHLTVALGYPIALEFNGEIFLAQHRTDCRRFLQRHCSHIDFEIAFFHLASFSGDSDGEMNIPCRAKIVAAFTPQANRLKLAMPLCSNRLNFMASLHFKIWSLRLQTSRLLLYPLC